MISRWTLGDAKVALCRVREKKLSKGWKGEEYPFQNHTAVVAAADKTSGQEPYSLVLFPDRTQSEVRLQAYI